MPAVQGDRVTPEELRYEIDALGASAPTGATRDRLVAIATDLADAADRSAEQITEALTLLRGIDYDEGSRVDRAVSALEG